MGSVSTVTREDIERKMPSIFCDIGALAILHDVNLAARYADRVVVLAEGRVAAAGTPAEALTPAVLAPVFAIPFRQIADPGGGPPILLAA